MVKDFFTYKNLRGDYSALENDIRLGMPTAVFGVSEVHKYLIAALTEGKVLYIAADAVAAQKAFQSISVLSGKNCVYLPAKDDVVLYKDALSKDALFKRLWATYKMAHGAEIVITEIEAVMQLFPESVQAITFKIGEDYDYSTLALKLVKMGYTREYAADTQGSFAVRGDILDIFPVGAENPVRIDFFGDTVEKIRPYDGITGERLEEVKEVTVIAATDAVIQSEEQEKLRAALTVENKKCGDVKSYERARAIC
ncbi:MAG: hypothetical protein K2N68_04495, partial [Clostridia bacterium]|nr:hypothetical protein [Clostridia bacterium]